MNVHSSGTFGRDRSIAPPAGSAGPDPAASDEPPPERYDSLFEKRKMRRDQMKEILRDMLTTTLQMAALAVALAVIALSALWARG
jgi:hypothetical protein